MNSNTHKSLDLHGKTYEEAGVLIDEFILRNSECLPIEVITGNSVDMHAILKEIVKKHKLKLMPSNSFNMGSYLVTPPLYLDRDSACQK